ncbi:MAG: holo-ACP synthase [Victivallales bacterium]|nr:holo-ACP synthase [Victivallales bacterium]
MGEEPRAEVAQGAVIGLGTDLVELDRLAQSVARSGEAFLRHTYSEAELAALPPEGPVRIAFLGGRWAAKEAVAKALGTGIGASCALREITVLNDCAGVPVLTLDGNAKRTAEEKGVRRILVSISHEKHYATATVILLS